MPVKATKRKPSLSRRLWAALSASALFGALMLAAPPVAASTAKSGKKAAAAQSKQHKASVRKAHKPSKAHHKLRSAIAEEAGEGEKAGEGKLGAASFYGFGFQGRKVASGERFDVRALTAASNHYPLGTWVAVRRVDNGYCVVVKVNDRMHVQHRTRIIDLSRGAAEKLHMISAGVVLVRVARLPDGPGEDAGETCARVFAKVRSEDCADCAPKEEAPLPVLPNLSEEVFGPPLIEEK